MEAASRILTSRMTARKARTSMIDECVSKASDLIVLMDLGDGFKLMGHKSKNRTINKKKYNDRTSINS